MTNPRRWWLRMEAQRRQVARALCRIGVVGVGVICDHPEHVLNGSQTFDVHAAREWAAREAALADDIDEHKAIVHDWRAEQRAGVHPSTVPGLPPGAPHDVLNWRARARVGRLVLDVLDGRCPWAPDEATKYSGCDHCSGRGQQATAWLGDRVIQERPCDHCQGTGHNLGGRIPRIRLSSPYLVSGPRDYARLVWKAGDVARATGQPDATVDAGALAVQCWLGCTSAQANTLIMLAHTDGFRGTGRPHATDERPLAWLVEVERCLAEGRELPSRADRGTRFGRRERGEHHQMWVRTWAPWSTWQERSRGTTSDATADRPSPGWVWDMVPRWRRGMLRTSDRTTAHAQRRRIAELEEMLAGYRDGPPVTFARLGHAARGDDHDCEACSGSGRSGDRVCDECFGRGRIETVTVQLPGAIHETVVTTTMGPLSVEE